MAFVEWGLPHQHLFQYEPDRNGGASILRSIATAKDENPTLIWNCFFHQNPKHEIRIPKQSRNSKSQFSK
jgi:hypothetical protein